MISKQNAQVIYYLIFSAKLSVFFYYFFSSFLGAYYFYSTFLDLDLVFPSFWPYYSDIYSSFPFEEASSKRNPSASVGLTLEAGSSQIYVLSLIYTSTPFPILASLMYVPLVLRSVT